MGTPLVADRLPRPGPLTCPVVLTVAGSDSSGGAGIQADLKTFTAIGVWGATAITAITAQNTTGVIERFPLTPEAVRAQIDAVAVDMPVAAVKTGMLDNRDLVETVADALRNHRLPRLVVDPVIAASQGGDLLAPDALELLLEKLLPQCLVFTPNLPEAETILGRRIPDRDSMRSAARDLADYGSKAVLLKGGHLGGDSAPDLLWHEDHAEWLEGPRIPSTDTHGTGCTFSAAVAAYVARGHDVVTACRQAKEFVAEAIKAAKVIGQGPGALDQSWSRLT